MDIPHTDEQDTHTDETRNTDEQKIRKRLVKKNVEENPKDKDEEGDILPVSSTNRHSRKQQTFFENTKTKSYALYDNVRTRMYTFISKIRRQLKDLKYRSNEDNMTNIERTRNFMYYYFQEHKYNLLFVIATLLFFGILYFYMSHTVMSNYVEDKKQEFWVNVDQQDSYLTQPEKQKEISDSNTLLCYNDASSYNETEHIFVGSTTQNPWILSCVSSCLSIAKKDYIKENEKEQCISYINNIPDKFNIYERMARIVLKQRHFKENCLSSTRKTCKHEAMIENKCTCNCKQPSLISISFDINDMHLWNLISMNFGNILFIDATKAFFTNYSADIINSRSVDDMDIISIDTEMNDDTTKKIIEESDVFSKHGKEKQQVSSEEVFFDRDEVLEKLYTEQESLSTQKNDAFFGGIFNKIGEGFKSVFSSEHSSENLDDTNFKNNPKSNPTIYSLTKSDMANFISVYMLSDYNKIYSSQDKDRNNEWIDTYIVSKASFCNPNKFLLDQIENPDYLTKDLWLKQFSKHPQSDLFKEITASLRTKITLMTPTFLTKYILLKQKTFDLFYVTNLDEAQKNVLHYKESPTMYKEVMFVQSSETNTNRDDFHLYYFLEYYYKSHGALETNFWSPFFGINNPNYVTKLMSHKTANLKQQPNNQNLHDYVSIISNVVNIIGDMATDVYTDSVDEKNTEMYKQYTNNEADPKNIGVTKTIKNRLTVMHPKTIKELNTVRNLITSRFKTTVGQTDPNLIYGKIINSTSNKSIFTGHVDKMLDLPLTGQEYVGELFRIGPDLIENTREAIHLEYSKLVSMVKAYIKLTNKSSKRTKNSLGISDLKFCACGFNFFLPYPSVFVSYQTFKQNAPFSESKAWYKPSIIDRSTKINPQKDIDHVFFKRSPNKNKDKIFGVNFHELNWEQDIYRYEYLYKMFKGDWMRIQNLIENQDVNPEGVIEFPLLYAAAIFGSNMEKSSIFIDGVVNQMKVMNMTNIDETNEKISEFIHPLSPSMYSIVEHYTVLSKDIFQVTKTHTKTSVFYESQCVDFCTSTWGILNEISSLLYHTNTIKEAADEKTPAYRCPKENLQKCSDMWAKIGN